MNKILSALALLGTMIFISCGDDDSGPGVLTVVSVSGAGTNFETGAAETGIDLFGAISVTNSPLDLTVEVTFNKDVDASTVDATSVTIGGLDDDNVVTVSVSGAVVTITTANDLDRGTDYTVEVASTVTAVDGGTLSGSVSATFGTAGVAPVTPPNEASQVAYWSFNGDDTDELGTYNANDRVAITYIEDRYGQLESAASFNGTTSIIEVPDATGLVDTDDFALSFWVKPNNSGDKTSNHFVIGLGGSTGFQFEISGVYENMKLAARYELDDGTTNPQDLWWFTTGNLSWQGWTFDKDVSNVGGLEAIIDQSWTHIITTYDATSKIGSMYVNGELVKQQDFNLYGESHPNFRSIGMTYAGIEPAHTGNLAFGFITDRASTAFDNEPWGNYESPDSNHFQGELDDVRIFHASFTAEQVLELYNAEKP